MDIVIKTKYKKVISLLIIFVILLSHSIIPVKASSDYYESTYNGYLYDCRSEFNGPVEVYAEMSYQGQTRISVEIEFQLYDDDLGYPVVLNVESPISRSFVYVGVLATNTQLFEWADYKYTIVPSVVYFVGLN
ncbi:MAG: hypothetical protein BWX78_01257 [Firmicutes bacterium ADurb.Bin099]|nr:MAG: hypothetical protein BWX78_01257 [Firmicutes bacterium ADurb.Bin099]